MVSQFVAWKPVVSVVLVATVLAVAGYGVIGEEEPGRETAPAAQNVVLIVIDALRADHLPCYGYHRETAPHLCSLGQQSAIFEHAYAQAPWSLASFATIFTSTYPPQHGATAFSSRVPANFTTLPEAFASQNYSTMGIADDGVLRGRWGLRQGFQQWFNPANSSFPPGHADIVSRRAVEYVQTTEKPFFLFIHVMDVHKPYEPKNQSLMERWDPDYNGSLNLSAKGRADLDNVSEEDVEQVVAAYDTSIYHTDRQLSRVIHALEAEGLMDETAIIVTSDHGETLHKRFPYFGHRNFYQQDIHVPLLLHYPGDTPRRIEEKVALIDVMPTLFALTGINPPTNQSITGYTLYPLDNIPRRPIYSFKLDGFQEGFQGKYQWDAVINGSMKLIRYPETPWGERSFELYNLSADPTERHDLSEESPQIVDSLFTLLQAAPSSSSNYTHNLTYLDDRLREQLRQIGYVE